jgi:hypothetical protein
MCLLRIGPAQTQPGFEGHFIQKPFFTARLKGSQFSNPAILATFPGFSRG